MTGKPASIREIAYVALCASLIVICAWITIPAAVPFTMQTFGVFLTLLLLGGRRGTVAVSVYLLLGAVGLPVFSGFLGGAGVLFGTTGGYLVGFLLVSLTLWAAERFLPNKNSIRFTALVMGLLLCYAAGTAWFLIAYARTTGSIGIFTALSWCVFPFILPDLAKLTLAALLSRRLRPLIRIGKAD